MFDRPKIGERCALVHIDFKSIKQQELYHTTDLEEFKSLVSSTDAEVLSILTGSAQTPNPKYFIGTGKIEELQLIINANNIELLLFNHSLSPSQQRNIEQELKCCVLDRTGLILDIFAQRAQTFEGKLQVELAQLNYMSTRLVRGWTHLERQKGGIGLRGPGEKQLELDKRMLGLRIKSIKKSLKKVQSRRNLSRSSRKKSEIKTVSLVGYTNAGKSTLFNALTSENIYTANKLFATLDPTLRKLAIPQLGEIILADTVGFIQNLPHQLVEAFKATLEETEQADLLLHIIDHSDENIDLHIKSVNQVLESLDTKNIPVLLIYNQIDKTKNNTPRIDYNDNSEPYRVWISAKQNKGFDFLFQAIASLLKPNRISGVISIPIDFIKYNELRADLFQNKCVIKELDPSETSINIQIIIDQILLNQLNKKYNTNIEKLIKNKCATK